MSVTRLGVSALNVVATMERPASHQGTERPEAKNSDVLRPARSPKNSAGPKQIRREPATISQSSVVRCMDAQSLADNHSEGLRPSDSPTRFRLRAKRYGETAPEPWRRRALASRFVGSLRSR